MLIDSGDFHEFVTGVPMAFAGLVQFSDLLHPYSQMGRVTFIKARASAVEGERCVRLALGSSTICGIL